MEPDLETQLAALDALMADEGGGEAPSRDIWGTAAREAIYGHPLQRAIEARLPGQTGTVRSRSTPLGDFVGGIFGPSAGYYASEAQRYAEMPARTQVGLVSDGLETAYHGVRESKPHRVGIGLAQLAMGAMPAGLTGRVAARAVQGLTGGALAGMGTALVPEHSLVSEAHATDDADYSTTPQIEALQARQQELYRQLDTPPVLRSFAKSMAELKRRLAEAKNRTAELRAIQKEIGAGVDGELGPETRAAYHRHYGGAADPNRRETIQQQIDAIGEQITALTARGKKEVANQAFHERFPEVAEVLPWAGQLAAIAAGGYFANRALRGANNIAQQIRGQAQAAESALARGSASDAADAIRNLTELKKRFEAMGPQYMPSPAELKVAIGAPVFATNFPHLYNLSALPKDTEGYQQSLDSISDPEQWLHRTALPVAEAVGGATIARGLATNVGRKPPPVTAAIEARAKGGPAAIASREVSRINADATLRVSRTDDRRTRRDELENERSADQRFALGEARRAHELRRATEQTHHDLRLERLRRKAEVAETSTLAGAVRRALGGGQRGAQRRQLDADLAHENRTSVTRASQSSSEPLSSLRPSTRRRIFDAEQGGHLQIEPTPGGGFKLRDTTTGRFISAPSAATAARKKRP